MIQSFAKYFNKISRKFSKNYEMPSIFAGKILFAKRYELRDRTKYPFLIRTQSYPVMQYSSLY